MADAIDYDHFGEGEIPVTWDAGGDPEGERELIRVMNTHGLITFVELANGIDLSFDLSDLLAVVADTSVSDAVMAGESDG